MVPNDPGEHAQSVTAVLPAADVALSAQLSQAYEPAPEYWLAPQVRQTAGEQRWQTHSSSSVQLGYCPGLTTDVRTPETFTVARWHPSLPTELSARYARPRAEAACSHSPVLISPMSSQPLRQHVPFVNLPKYEES